MEGGGKGGEGDGRGEGYKYCLEGGRGLGRLKVMALKGDYNIFVWGEGREGMCGVRVGIGVVWL